jgi:hypothetical protein
MEANKQTNGLLDLGMKTYFIQNGEKVQRFLVKQQTFTAKN